MILKITKKYVFSILFVVSSLSSFAQYTLISDPNFEKKLVLLGIDTDSINGKVLTSNIAQVENLHVSDADITDLTGIEGFTSLMSLRCKNNKLTNLDLSQNLALTKLQCFENQIVNLNVTNNKALSVLDCSSNMLETINLTENVNLEYLNCSNNSLYSLFLNYNTKLVDLDCYQNKINNLLLNHNTTLVNLHCQDNNIGNLDVSNNLNLLDIIAYKNNLKSVNLNNCTKLGYLDLHLNALTSLDVRNDTLLNYLDCSENLNLPIICVHDEVAASNNPDFIKDPNAEWSETCIINQVENTNQDKNINVFPNPASKSIVVDINENAFLNLINPMGVVVIQNQALDQNHNQIEIDNFPAGIYKMHIRNDSFTINKLIVIE